MKLTEKLPLCLLALLLLLLCLAGLSWPQAEGQGLEVRAASQGLKAAAPGEIVTLSFRITNSTAQEEVLLERLQLPAGWQLVTPEASLILGPSQETTRLLAFQVPHEAAAGPYEVSYGVRSQRDPALEQSATGQLIVLARTKLALLVEAKPDSVIAGAPYQVQLRLLNQSNLALLVKLELVSEPLYPAQLAPLEVLLPAGESIPLLVKAETDPKARRLTSHYLQIKAQAEEPSGKQVRAELVVGVEVIPRVTGELDPYHRLPVEFSLRLSGEGGAGLQAELRGKGTLDEADAKRVEFLLRGPDTQQQGLFGLQSEYWLDYSTEDLAVRAGDQSYALSRLTSSSSFGQGLSVELHPQGSPLRFGAYYLDQGGASPARQEGGLYWARQLNPKTSLQINCLKQEQEAWAGLPASEALLWSSEAQFQLAQNMRLELEYAHCQSDRYTSKADEAYRLEWEGRLGQGGYWRMAKIHAGPDYYGASHDSDYSYAALTYPLSERLVGSLAYNRYKRNLEQQVEGGTADREALLQAGARYNLDPRWYLSVDYDDFQRRDLLEPAQYDFSERALRLGLGGSSPKWSLRAELRLGEQEDRLRGEQERVQSYNFYTSYRPQRDLALSFYAGFGEGQALRGSRLLGGDSSVGASAIWQLGQRLQLEGWYTKHGFESDYALESEQYDLRLRAQLPSGHKLALEVRKTSRELWGSETSYQLAYSLPLDLPVSRKRSVGSVKGCIYDAEAPGHPGVEGAILRINGATAVTDKQGRFVFPSLTPGNYQLFLDRASIGLNRVSDKQLPLTVIILAGKATQVELGLGLAARLSGSVLVMPVSAEASRKATEATVVGAPEGNSPSQVPTGLMNTLVELVRDQECLRSVTDSRGQFLFEGLRPGLWHLKIYDHNLLPYYYLESPDQDLQLEPGANFEVTVRLWPKTRQIRFIDAGTIQVGVNP